MGNVRVQYGTINFPRHKTEAPIAAAVGNVKI